MLLSAGPSHETPCISSGHEAGMGNIRVILEKLSRIEDRVQVFETNVPLFAGVAVAVTNPDGALITPGWSTLTGPSLPMISVSVSLELLA